MPHLSCQWCALRFALPLAAHTPINYVEAASLERLLTTDSVNYCYSAFVCIADALSSVQRQYYSWATVKLYYATFYAVRGLLALRGTCVFYMDHKPYILEAQPGMYAAKPNNSDAKSGTHGLVLHLFRRTMPNHLLLSQPIDNINSLDWIKSKREEVNYGHARYVEPSVPDWFKKLAQFGIRKTLNAYAADSSHTFAFDRDHAALAFPLLSCRSLLSEIVAKQGTGLTKQDQDFLAKQMVDRDGPLAEMIKILKS